MGTLVRHPAMSAVAVLLCSTVLYSCVSLEDSEEAVADVHEARSSGQAKRAITVALHGVGVGQSSKGGTYAAYTLTSDKLDRLSERQADFNEGNPESGRSMQEIYGLSLRTDRPPAVNLETALDIMNNAANLALQQREPDEILLMAFGDGAELPASFEQLTRDAVVSPFQAYMFGIWLHANGAGLGAYHEAVQSIGLGKVAWMVPACRLQFIECTMTPTTDCDPENPANAGLNDLNDCISNSPDLCYFGTCADGDPAGCETTYASCISAAGGDDQDCEDDRILCQSLHGGGDVN